MAGTYEQAIAGELNATGDPKILAQLKGMNEKLNSENLIPNSALASETKPFDWYTPSVIATEESRTNVAYGKLTTPDEITGVVLPTNGLLLIGFSATVKASAKEQAGRIAIFLGANQLKYAKEGGEAPAVVETTTSSVENVFIHVSSTSTGQGLARSNAKYTGDVTTGQVLGATETKGGLMAVYAAAGTYAISAQYLAESGSITAKERKLWCGVAGV